MGKASSSGLVDTLRDKLTRRGRASTVPSRLRDSDGERPPRGAGGKQRGGGRGGGCSSTDRTRVQKLRSITDIGGWPRTSSSEVPSTGGTAGEDDEDEEEYEQEGEDSESEEVQCEERATEDREEFEGEQRADGEEGEEEGTGEEGWLRGVATLPRRPATEAEKTLIIPKGTNNWEIVGEGRIPNGVITILLRKYWPGLFNPRPDADPPCEERVLAVRWHHYKAARLFDHGTHAQAVRDRFWEFYRVAEGDKARADKVFEAAAALRLRQMPYEARWVAITQFYHTILRQKMTKSKARAERPPLTKEQYMDVIPGWCNGKADGWSALVDRWLGEDESFAATSTINTKNRGSDGTHIQGNRSHHRFKKHKEAVLKRPISHIEAWSLGRVRKDPKKGESPYYGKSEEHLTNYKASFIERNPPGVDPIASETDETAMVMSAHGRPHGRSGVLDGVFQPAISYVQLRTSSTGASAANPSRARPSRSKEEEAYSRYVKTYRQEFAEHEAKRVRVEEYRAQQLQNMYIWMESGTRAAPMGPAPPNPGPTPVMLTMEEFLTRGDDETLGSGQASYTPGDGTPASGSPMTPVHNPGGGGSTSCRGSPLF